MGSIVLLALASAVSPALLAGVMVMMKRPSPKPLLIGFLLGGWVASVVSGLIIVFLLRDNVSSTNRRTVNAAVDVVVGAASLMVAAVLLRPGALSAPGTGRIRRLQRRHRARAEARPNRREPLAQRLLGHDSPKAAVAYGAVLKLPRIWYLAALTQIAATGYHLGISVLLILGFNAIMFVLVEVPLVGFMIRPDSTRIQAEHLQEWLKRNARALAGTAAAMIGVYLLLRGILEHLVR